MNSPYIGIYKCGNDSGLQFIQIGLLYEIVTERTELVWQELHTKILSFQGETKSKLTATIGIRTYRRSI